MQDYDLSWGAPTQEVIWSFNHMALRGHTTNEMCDISTFTRPVDTKHGKVMIYCEGRPPIKSHKPSKTWSHEVTWQIGKIISPLHKVYSNKNWLGGEFREEVQNTNSEAFANLLLMTLNVY